MVTQQLDRNEIVTFREMFRANSVMVDALDQLLIDKGIISQNEFFIKLRGVQGEYEGRGKKSIKG